jgi:hypothetical protein
LGRIEAALDEGLIRKHELLHLLADVGALADGNQLGRIFEALVYWDALIDLPYEGGGNAPDYRTNFDEIDRLEAKSCLENVVKGPGYFINKCYQATVALIVDTPKGESIGSGCVLDVFGKRSC